MSIIRVGTNQKFSEGWEKAFGKGGKKKDTGKKKATPSRATAQKASAKKKVTKKKAKK